MGDNVIDKLREPANNLPLSSRKCKYLREQVAPLADAAFVEIQLIKISSILVHELQQG